MPPSTCTGGLTQPATNGVAAFTGCQITGLVGSYTLTATDDPDGLTPATSTAITITVGAPAQLAFTTQPGGGHRACHLGHTAGGDGRRQRRQPRPHLH